MIQAIVFLPLLGAVLAGIIAIAGAHARHPSGLEMDHGDHGHGHGHDAHAHDAHASHGHDDHSHDHPVEPAAAGSRAAELITTTLLLVSAALSWITFVNFGFQHQDARIALLVLTVAAAEAAIGLAVLVVFFRNRGSIAVEDINVMKG